MSYASRMKHGVLAVISIGALGAIATADLSSSKASAQGKASTQGIHADGAGTVHLPTIHKDGLLVGVLVGEKLGTRYTVEAKLTSFLPVVFDPVHQMALGGMYGWMREVAQDGSLGAHGESFDGWVEGVWMMGRDLSGTYEAILYSRSESGAAVVAGSIRGKFQVEKIRPDGDGSGLGDAADLGASKKKGRALDDAASGSGASKRPALEDSASSRTPDKPLGPPVKDKSFYRSAAAGQFGTPEGRGFWFPGPGFVVDHEFAGAFRARAVLIL